MNHSRFGRAAFAPLLAVFALAIAVSPASAAITSISFIPSAAGNSDATLVQYTVSPDSPMPNDACGSRRGGTVTLSVSASGDYRFSDARAGGFIPSEYSPATPTLDVGDGVTVVTRGDDCVGFVDDIATVRLEAGQQYTLSLASLFGLDGDYAFLLSGPGEVTVNGFGPTPDGVSFEQAQTACMPGAAAPAGYNVVDGSSRNETLRGTEGNDLIRGLGGNDTLIGAGGDDILCGGAGNDSLQGGAGEDFLFGEAGNDSLQGGADDDVISGGLGNDALNGGAGFDIGLDTQGNNTFTSIESRTLEPAPAPGPSPSPTPAG